MRTTRPAFRKRAAKPAGPRPPSERGETLRREIIFILEEGERSARDISRDAGIPEKDVYGHLEHIRKSLKSLKQGGPGLRVTPAECKQCGFVFKKRERLTKPGKCPVCRGTSIIEPLFSIGA